MKAFCIATVGIALVVFGSGQAGEKTGGSAKIIGSWEVVKSDDAPAGSSVEFTKDGKLIFIPKGKEGKKLEATYQVNGNKLTTKRVEKGKEEMNNLTIQVLNDTTLITLSDNGKTDEMKRVASK